MAEVVKDEQTIQKITDSFLKHERMRDQIKYDADDALGEIQEFFILRDDVMVTPALLHLQHTVHLDPNVVRDHLESSADNDKSHKTTYSVYSPYQPSGNSTQTFLYGVHLGLDTLVKSPRCSENASSTSDSGRVFDAYFKQGLFELTREYPVKVRTTIARASKEPSQVISPTQEPKIQYVAGLGYMYIYPGDETEVIDTGFAYIKKYGFSQYEAPQGGKDTAHESRLQDIRERIVAATNRTTRAAIELDRNVIHTPGLQ